MPFTILLILHRLPTLTPTAFKTHYETTHMPLIRSLAGPTFPNSHTRHYIQRTSSPPSSNNNNNNNSNADPYPATVLIGTQADFEYDAFALLEFDDEAAYQRFFGVISEEGAAGRIAEDEEMFLDRGRMRAVVLGGIERSGGSVVGGGL